MSVTKNRTPVPALKLDSRLTALSSPYGSDDMNGGDGAHMGGNDNLLKMAMQSSPISKAAAKDSNLSPSQQHQSDWITYYDEESGHEYLYNQRTGESKWPSPLKQQQQSKQGGYSYNNENVDSNAAASGGDYAHYNISGSDPWIRGYDDQGQEYMYNSITGESKWPSPDKAAYAHTGAANYVDETDSNIDMGTADGGSYGNYFSRYYDDNGYEYFFNDATGESKWLLDAGDVLVNASSEEAERYADYGYAMYSAPDPANPGPHPSPKPLPLRIDVQAEGSEGGSGGGSGAADRARGAGAAASGVFWQDSLSVPGSGMKNPFRARGPPPLQSPGSPYRSKAARPSTATHLRPSLEQPLTVGDAAALESFLEGDEERGSKRFERLRVGSTSLRQARGESDNIVWLELQAAGQGPVFYCRAGELGGQWEKPLVFRRLDAGGVGLGAMRERRSPSPTPGKPPHRPVGPVVSRLVDAERGEAEARAIYRQVKAREASGDLQVEYAELKRRTEEAKRKWNRFLVAADDAADERAAGEAVDSFLDSDSDEAPGGPATAQGAGLARPGGGEAVAAFTADFDVLYARSIVVKQVWPWTCLVDMKTDRNFYRNEQADTFTFDIPDCFKAPDRDEEDEFALLGEESDAAGVASADPNPKYQLSAVDIRHGESAAQLVQRFKDELLQRRAFATQSHSRLRMSHTSAAQERGMGEGGFDAFVAAHRPRATRSNSIFASSDGDSKHHFADYDPPSGADPAEVELIAQAVRSKHYQERGGSKKGLFRYEQESEALLDRMRRMVKPVAVEDQRAEPADGRVVKKLSVRALREKAEAEAERRRVALANELSAQSSQVHDIALRMVDIEDADEEGSWLEQEVFRRHALECAAMQRSQLVMPAGLLEAKAHPLLPLNLCCPSALSAEEFRASFGHLYSGSTNRHWEQLDGSSRQLPPLWLHAKSGIVQSSRPFDELLRERKKSLTHEDWSDFERLHARHGSFDCVRQLDLLSDDEGGLLYYCPKRDMYSFDGGFDVEIFELELMQKRLGRVMRGAHRGSTRGRAAHQPSKKMMSRRRLKPSGSEKNVWLRLPPLAPVDPDEFENNTRANTRASINGYPPAGRPASPLKMLPTTRTIGNLLASKNTSVVPGLHDSIADFEAFLGTMVSTSVTSQGAAGVTTLNSIDAGGLDRLIDDQVRDDSTSLVFERCFDDGSFEDYKKILIKLSKNPKNPVTLFQLALWLQLSGLGREAYAVVVRANEALSDNRQEFLNYCYCQLLEMKLAARYHSTYHRAKRITQLANMCPESEVVLAQVAKFLHRIRYTRQSEQIFIGALLLNPLGHFALRGYAHLLIEKGNYHSAYRYLARVGADALTFNLAQVEMAWLHELMGSEADVVMLHYKSCNSVKKDRASSLAFHSIGHFHHVRGEISKAMDSYRRALYHHPNNAYALLLMSCIPDALIMPVDRADACFRKGLFLLRCSHRWAVLLAYGEFVAARTGDLLRAQQLLREAAKLSFSRSVWPALAYAHFLQYVRGKPAQGRRVLRWAMRRHRQPSEEEMAALDRLLDEPESEGDYEEGGQDYELLAEEKKSNNDRVPLLTAMAYQALELRDLSQAVMLAHDALKIDPHYAPAHRLLGLVDWSSVRGREEAARHFTKALKCSGSSNPYTLRTCAVVLVLEGSYADALRVMSDAVAVGNNCPLAWRGLGIMSYLYGGSPTQASACLSRALELSGGMDVEAGRLRGLILLEGGRYADARLCFQQCLTRQPCDSHTLACLAMAVAGLGFKPPSGVHDYDKIIRARNSALELGLSEDPEELFRAACFTGLDEVFAAKSSKTRSPLPRNNNGDNDSDKGIHETPPEILYWFGMYHLKRSPGSKKAMVAAKELFTRAVQRVDCSPHPLAIYMLGWVEECSGNLETAEKYYCYALQLDPIDPMYFLRLLQLVQDTTAYVKGLLKGSEMLHKKRLALKKKNSRKRVSLDVFAVEDADSEEELLKQSKLPSVKEMRRRILLHQRVVKLSKMRERRLRPFLRGLAPVGRLVHIDPFWADRLMIAFGGCDDWSALMRATREVRDRAEAKAGGKK